MSIALAGAGDDAGVVSAEANLKFIWDVVSAIQVGQGGYAYVVDARGRLIAHPDISLVLQKTEMGHLPQIAAALNASPEGPDATAEAIAGHSLDGREMLSSFARIDPLGWLVFVELPLKEALAPLYASAVRTAVLLLIGVALSVVAGLWLVRRMVAPIHTLRAGAATIGGGNLDHRIDVKSGDELEALGGEFNRMAERLRESYAGLERKVEERTSELTEALEQQTATAEILRVMSSSPTTVQPVLDAVVESAAKFCGATNAHVSRVQDNRILVAAANYGDIPIPPDLWLPLDRESVTARSAVDKATIHIPDVRAADDSLDSAKQWANRLGYRAIASTPMLREGVAVGVLSIRRIAPGPFTDKQIELLKTFADQAVIAIENVRLFNELQTRSEELARSVDQLRALAEVSQAVNSTLDLQQVLETIVARAVQLSGTDTGAIYEHDEAAGALHLRATHGMELDVAEYLLAKTIALGEGASGRAAQTGEPIEVPDLHASDAYDSRLRPLLDEAGLRSILAVPLLQDKRVVGSLTVSRREVGHFPPQVVELLRTFATQSTLAIQNARLFREIAQKSRELEIASQHKSQFLANMSHELRTPLNAILGYTELITDQIYGEVPEKIAEVLGRVQKSGQHLLGLINDVLDLSKIEAGQLVLSANEYSFQDVVQGVVSSVESLAAEKRLELAVNVASTLPVGYGDERRIRQVLLNLVGNAIKFTDAGKVEIRVRQDADQFEVAVADTGPGIDAEHQQRIFEEFQQVDSSPTKTKGGTGLGLAIAKRIVELHGGRIWVESTPGEGSSFYFSIPIKAGSTGGVQ
jgi:signal transduction histidine kinase